MNNRVIYKRVKIKWWIILILVGILAGTYLFLCINQWSNRPLDKTGVIYTSIIMAVICIGAGLLGGWSKLIIDDYFAIFRFDMLTVIKMPIVSIRNVSVERIARLDLHYLPKKDFVKCFFDLKKQAIRIELKSGKVYQITIENPQKIKEEIEKRKNDNNQ